MRCTGNRELSDERILGSGEFAERMLKEASAKVKYQFTESERMQKADEFMTVVCHKENVNITELRSGSRRKNVSRVRTQLAIGLVEEYGISLAEAARLLGVTTSAISKIVKS